MNNAIQDQKTVRSLCCNSAVTMGTFFTVQDMMEGRSPQYVCKNCNRTCSWQYVSSYEQIGKGIFRPTNFDKFESQLKIVRVTKEYPSGFTVVGTLFLPKDIEPEDLNDCVTRWGASIFQYTNEEHAYKLSVEELSHNDDILEDLSEEIRKQEEKIEASRKRLLDLRSLRIHIRTNKC